MCIEPDDDLERRRSDIKSAVKKASADQGVIILTDMFGGTPSNLAISLLEKNFVEVIAGVNLPMLIKLAEGRQSSKLDAAAEMAKTAGQRYIAIASEILASDL